MSSNQRQKDTIQYKNARTNWEDSHWNENWNTPYPIGEKSNSELSSPASLGKSVAPVQKMGAEKEDPTQLKEEEGPTQLKEGSGVDASPPQLPFPIQRKADAPDSGVNMVDVPFQMKREDAAQLKEGGEAISSPNSSGSETKMPDNVQAKMEDSFNSDFSGVNIHKDSQSATDLGAQAYTQGNDVHFAPGKYDPESQKGQELIGHELTHVEQQRQNKVAPTVQAKGVAINDDPGLEKEADEMGEKAAAGKDTGMNASPIDPDQNNNSSVQKKDAAEPAPAEEVLELPVTDITSAFRPGKEVAEYLDANHGKAVFIPVKIGKIASGELKVKQSKKAKEGGDPATYFIYKNQGIALTAFEFLDPLRGPNFTPVVALDATDQENIKGVLSVKVKDTVAPDPRVLIQQINKNLEPLGLLGVKQFNVPNYTNEVVGGKINLQVNDLKTQIAGYLDATATFGLNAGVFVFDINAHVDIEGLASGDFHVKRGEDKKFSGEGTIQTQIANVNGQLDVTYAAGDVTIKGKVGIESEKFSGELNFMVADQKTADKTMQAELGIETIEEESKKPADPKEVKKTKANQKVVGWGTVTARITPWLEGKASVGIDSKGQVTIIGEITTPDEIELMEQKGKKIDLFNVEIKGGYGVPLVGQIGLFASIGMFINAGFGPLILKDVGFKGKYSTDPNVKQNFEITGKLNIGAFAIVGLEAEAGAFLTLLGHDIKAGINLTAAAGIRAYAEVEPTFLYEEKAAPDGGKIGEAWLKGHFEAAAQLFLKLSGAFFVELDSPWWSPAPDDRWDYPLFDVEYPIGDSMGIGGDVEWLVGSDDAPELEFSPVEFDPDKFHSDIMADPPPGKGGGKSGEQEGDGKWDDGSKKGDKDANPEVQKGGEGLDGKKKKEDISKLSEEEKYMRALGQIGDIGDDSKKKPLTAGVLKEKVNKIKSKYRISKATVDVDDGEAEVYVSHGKENNKRNLIKVRLMTEAERMKLLMDAKKDLETQIDGKKNKEDNTLGESDAKAIASNIKKNHYVFESFSAEENGEKWSFAADLGDKVEKIPGPVITVEKAEGKEGDAEVGKKIPFSAGKENHNLWIEVKDGKPQVMMASTVQTVDTFLKSSDVTTRAASNAAFKKLVDDAKVQLKTVALESEDVIQALKNAPPQVAGQNAQVVQQEKEIIILLRQIFQQISNTSLAKKELEIKAKGEEYEKQAQVLLKRDIKPAYKAARNHYQWVEDLTTFTEYVNTELEDYIGMATDLADLDGILDDVEEGGTKIQNIKGEIATLEKITAIRTKVDAKISEIKGNEQIPDKYSGRARWISDLESFNNSCKGLISKDLATVNPAIVTLSTNVDTAITTISQEITAYVDFDFWTENTRTISDLIKQRGYPGNLGKMERIPGSSIKPLDISQVKNMTPVGLLQHLEALVANGDLSAGESSKRRRTIGKYLENRDLEH